MWVADERKDEYLAAGHTLAASCVKPTEEKIVEPTEKKVSKPGRPRKKK